MVKFIKLLQQQSYLLLTIWQSKLSLQIQTQIARADHTDMLKLLVDFLRSQLKKTPER